MWGLLGFSAIACAIAVAYTLYTQHVWEDYFITFRHSRNLAEGRGLVFTPGERVHGFTSPMGVLLPALLFRISGSDSYLPALWMFRGLSILAYAGCGVLLIRSLQADRRVGWGAACVLGGLYLLHVTLLDYAINGMETAFMALLAAWGLYLAVRGVADRWVAFGLCFAGFMWTRPDGFTYVGALAIASLAFPNTSRKAVLVGLVKAMALGGLLYLPWFLWAWWYYGSPVPHTIVAKSLVESGPLVQLKIIVKETADHYFAIAAKAFLPIYVFAYRAQSQVVEWHPGLLLVANTLGVFCAGYWALPVRDRIGRIASLTFALMTFYFTTIPSLFDWYLPPAAVLGYVALVRGIWTLAGELQARSPGVWRVAFAVLAVVIVERAVLFGQSAYQLRIQQAEIETGTRTEIGLWLKDHVRPGDRVFLECLGYIGYFSGAHMLDWPGLGTPEVVRLRREKQENFRTVVPELEPEWAVLRASEVDFMRQDGYFDAHYAPVITFDARPRLERYGRIPGRSYLDLDSVFTVFRRKDAGGGPTDETPAEG